jgi:hypothetical protein
LSTTLLCAATALSTSIGLIAPGAEAQEMVTSFAPAGTTDTGVWFESDVRPGGAAGTEDLSGLGDALENDQPLPIGAARLTTDLTNAAKAEVAVIDGYGMPEDILPSLAISYSYHKAANPDPGHNLFAAPSIKLTFFNPVCDDPASAGDCFGTLVYEPYWNQPWSIGAASLVPLDEWIAVTIDADDGVFWWNGGFGEPSGAGGPPLRTLAAWATFLSSDFADSELFQISIGVGTFNQGQIGYFDDVQIVHASGDGFDKSYDFEPQIGPPEDKDECKNGGWQTFNTPVFRNQGDCVSFVVSNGRAQRHS